MTLGEMTKPVYDRLVASLTAGSYGGIYFGLAPRDVMPAKGDDPIVIFDLAVQHGEHGHQFDQCEVTVTFQVVDARENGSANSVAICARIYGNADPGQIDPTYGFHRHKLEGFRFAAGVDEVVVNSSSCLAQSESGEHTEDFLVWVLAYTFKVRRP
jgi:hypothetical protein